MGAGNKVSSSSFCDKNNNAGTIVTLDPKPLAVIQPTSEEGLVATSAPITSSYNEKIRPLLDAVDDLRRLNVMKEGIQLPTIVVVGDHIARNMPEIVKQINEKLNTSLLELNSMPKVMSSTAEVMTTFMRVMGSTKDSLRKLFLRGEFEEYPDNKQMHSTARLVEMLNQFSDELQKCAVSDPNRDFLVEELSLLEESKSIGLPNFLPRNAFLVLLQKKVDGISLMPVDFMEKVWDYIEKVVSSVLIRHSSNYYQLQAAARQATDNFIAKMKNQSVNRVMEIVGMEKLTDYTCNPEYLLEWKKLINQQEKFFKIVREGHLKVNIEGFANIEVSHLRNYSDQVLHQAFDLKVRMIAYWKILLRRLVDNIALHLQFTLHNLVNKDLESEIVTELLNPHSRGIEQMMEESPYVAGKREKLSHSIDLLRNSKAVVAKIMDNFYVYSD
ncbi:hypothetical protein ACFE04_025133 [Oxalis oulophora]